MCSGIAPRSTCPLVEKTADREEKSTDLLWCVCLVFHPPANGLRKGTDHVIEHIVSGDIRAAIFEILPEDINEIAFEMMYKQFAAFREEQPSEIRPAIVQMVQNMRELCLQVHGFSRKIMGALPC